MVYQPANELPWKLHWCVLADAHRALREAQTDALNAVGWDQPVQDLEALVAQRFFGPLDCGKKLLCEKKLNTVRAS